VDFKQLKTAAVASEPLVRVYGPEQQGTWLQVRVNT
jgi:hypothetical protein